MLVCVFGDEIRNITAEESISAAFEAALTANFCVPGALLNFFAFFRRGRNYYFCFLMKNISSKWVFPLLSPAQENRRCPSFASWAIPKAWIRWQWKSPFFPQNCVGHSGESTRGLRSRISPFGICLLPESPIQIPPALVLHLSGIPWCPTGKSSQNLVNVVIIKNSLALKGGWGRNGELSRQQNVSHCYQVVPHEFKN